MIQIREARLEDGAAIAEISTESLGYPCQGNLVERRLKEMDTASKKVFVAVMDTKVVGFVQVELYQLLYQEDMVNVLGLAVRKDAQNMGVGSRLMQQVEDWALKKHCTAVRLNSATGRTEAHGFYENRGYVNTKSQKRFVKKLR